ncbi:DoxX-like family protein [Paenibacillus sp. LHD-38]|uniref:DoxX-like family protein n=1 Tax=Paenibacillus sp. LHD-38 TaxID=3072143 RepID=UPI00280EC782|nr:DoxX-like family protein [Paenibacillus sp. LHD-38]MDQ8733684.1 DoxX-like family protein [Paenibacillus sp. LHD-38]
MKNKPIYVELDIDAALSELWEHTQDPRLHEQWDLRFTEIEYLPRADVSEKQLFRYATRIGFGFKIAGMGETCSTTAPNKGMRLSTLAFSSEQQLSLIRKGGGYWKYEENGNRLTFITLFDYQTRFGFAGKLLDRYLFRPLFGYATAWSFDRLRIWLEERIPPSFIAERALIHYMSVILIMLLWCYEGLVPKLFFPEAGELYLMRKLGWFEGSELQIIQLIGILEIGLGLITAFWHRRSGMYTVQALLLLLLTAPMILFAPELLAAPFNPLTLALPMIGLCFAARWSSRYLPQASRCRRKYSPSLRKEGITCDRFTSKR